jgi:hypothetical protein
MKVAKSRAKRADQLIMILRALHQVSENEPVCTTKPASMGMRVSDGTARKLIGTGGHL